MNTSFILIFFSYISAMIFIGWWVSRRQKSGDDFLFADRKVPFLLSLGTTVATMVGTGSSMGAVGFAYHNGWAGALYGLGGALGILFLAWIFAPIRKFKFSTMSEELSYYVDNNVYVKNIVAFIIYAASIGWLGAHVIGGGMYLSWLTGIDMHWAKLLIALSFAIYVVIGGYTAVVWTDSIQAIILFIGFIAMAYFSIDYIGGWQTMISAQPEVNVSFLAIDKLGVLPAISLAFAVFVGVMATPSFRQRIYSGKCVKTVRKSFIYSGILYLGFSLVPAVIGMSAYSMEGQLDNAAFAFPHIALNVMPITLGALIIIAGISATLSSASSDAIAGVSVLLTDIYELILGRTPNKDKMVLFSRLGLIFTISTALVLAMLSNNIISYITNMISILMSGMCVCGLLGRLWPRYNWQGAIATLISGMLTAISVSSYKPWNDYFGNPVLPSIAFAFLTGVLITVLTSRGISAQSKNTAVLNKLSTEKPMLPTSG
ncbi:MAG: sodium:solute symporter family protein [Colwellia sp.]